MVDMEIESKNFPVNCDRMTRGIKRLLDQGELLSLRNKKAEGQVSVEVRRCNGKKYVRVFRSPNKENKQSDEDDKSTQNSDESLVEEQQNFAQELNSFSALLLRVIYQIKSKCLSSTQNEAKALPGVGDKNLGMAL